MSVENRLKNHDPILEKTNPILEEPVTVALAC